MALEQIIDIPPSRNIQVRPEIPVGRCRVLFFPEAADSGDVKATQKAKGNWRRLCGCCEGSGRTVADFLEDKSWDNLLEEVRNADKRGGEISPLVIEKATQYGWTIDELRSGTYR